MRSTDVTKNDAERPRSCSPDSSLRDKPVNPRRQPIRVFNRY